MHNFQSSFRLETVSSTFQDLAFDESLYPLYIGCCQNRGIKTVQSLCEHVAVNFVAQ